MWVFTNSNANLFNTLSRELDDTRADALALLESQLSKYPSLEAKTASIRDDAKGLGDEADGIADAISEFQEAEAKFLSEPDTNMLKEFVDSIEEFSALLEQFDSDRLDYDAAIKELKQGIAQTPLDVETKRNLNNLAEVPQNMLYVSSRIKYGLDIHGKNEEAYNTALTQADNFVQDLELREKRGSAWLLIYGFDEEVVEETQLQGIDSLQKLVDLVLSEEYIYKWELSREIPGLQESWSKTNNYYSNGSFDSAEVFAKESKKTALKVFKAGLAVQENPVNFDLFFTGAILLIFVMIILYAVRNREKLKSFLSLQQGEEEEVQEYDWKN